MTSTDSAARRQRAPVRPLALEPISDLKEGDQILGADKNDGTIDLWGHCKPWCYWPREVAANQDSGVSVAEHGAYCDHVVTFVDGREVEGYETFMRVSLVSAYLHGVYDLAAWQTVDTDPLIRFSIQDSENPDGDPAAELFISTGEARKLARALELAADRLDNLR